MKSLIAIILFINLFTYHTMAQQPNYDESKVPLLSIPDLMVMDNGNAVTNKTQWEKQRRPELLSTFANEVYGQLPKDLDKVEFEVSRVAVTAVAKSMQVLIKSQKQGKKHEMKLHVFLPKTGEGPFPVLLLISHRNVAELLKEPDTGFFPIAKIIGQGFAAAVFDVEDVAPDDPARFSDGILQQLYPDHLEREDGMRGLSAWAWGAMRAMDYFVSEPMLDHQKAGVVGHSRGGKAALWCGANDSRWALTVSNESGCGGAALSKRQFGETIQRINTGFPYWFADNFKQYNGKEAEMAFDQHMLIASIAPRAVYVASAAEDLWADPKGEYLSLRLATSVYRDVYGLSAALPAEFDPTPNVKHQPKIGYHLRSGKHDLTAYDWERFMEFFKEK